MTDVDDGLRAIGTMTTWVTHADAKAGLLFAAVAVAIAAMAQDRDTIADVVRPAGAAEVVSLLLLVCMGVSLAVAVVVLGVAVTPRTHPGPRPTRFGLATLADPSWTFTPVGRTEVAEEAWSQAAVLARIAQRKFSYVKLGSLAVTAVLLLLGAWIVATSFVT